MLMTLDMFVFETGTLPYQELRRRSEWRYGEGERYGVRPASQFLGPSTETVEVTGKLYPGENIGSYSSTETIRTMADKGEAYTLTSGYGEILGTFFIRSLEVTQSLFFVDGAPRASDFTLSLERADG
ncbi:oxidoreductase [Altererythrobacter indicus]|uniref:Oxidoreductase n=1 Tax=Altericroceibacterium indicum TaxID=374177 RepID=A0A845A569_9SPHN|nr:phage tail protein [Altericroceibacterium indicum]MXP25452.1 oxidoreductase [Altericroceibacterium indicum]